MPVDGVFLSLHGAAIGTGQVDPDGVILERVRALVGPGVPVLATLDLHANVSRRMVANASVLVAYRTNPHVDMAERGEECARLMREMLAGANAHGRLREAADDPALGHAEHEERPVRRTSSPTASRRSTRA